jgi:hypothetical protein
MNFEKFEFYLGYSISNWDWKINLNLEGNQIESLTKDAFIKA